MTFNEREKRNATAFTFNLENVGTFVQGDYANAAAALNSPSAKVALSATLDTTASTVIASNGEDVGALDVAISRLAERDTALAAQIRTFAAALQKARDVGDEVRNEANEQLLCLVEEAMKPPNQRQPRGVMKALAKGLHDTLGVSADLAQLASVFYPQLLTMLAITS
jgi:hypothetical protein